MIFFGVILIRKFDWITYVFGCFLVFTALKMLFKKEEEEEFNPKKSTIYKIIGKFIPIAHHRDKEHFIIKENNRNYATPLLVALLVIEVMDVVFAMDSVPAILAITSDPFLVFSSNIFAILGLRSMYFFLANMLQKFSYLEYSLIAILCFIGIKMLVIHFYKFPEWISLGFIAISLVTGILISLKKANTENNENPSRDEE
jgi:tellurite resistance protein TerC